MAKTLISYVDVAGVKAKYKAATDDLRSRLPLTDADGKPVDKNKHFPHDETLQKFVNQAVTLEVLDAIATDLKADVFSAVKG